MAVRSFASAFSIELSLLSTIGKLYPIRETADAREARFNRICPKCKNSRMSQVYTCLAGCTPDTGGAGWTLGETAQGKEVDGKIVVVDDEEAKEIRGSSMEKNRLELSIYEASDIDAKTFAGSVHYVFVPDRADNGYAGLLEVLRSGKALAGVCNLGGTEKFVRLVPHGSGFVVSELIRPQEMRHFDLPDVKVGEREATMARQLAEALTDTFDPETVRSTVVERMRAAMAAKSGQPVGTVVPMVAKAKPDNLEAALQAAIAAASAARMNKAS